MSKESLQKAYHETTKEAFSSIMEDGAIVPLAIRIDDESLRASCDADISDVYRKEGIIPADAVRKLIEYFLKIRPPYHKRESIPPDTIHSRCLEILLGYGEGVLLNVGEWVGGLSMPKKEYGFVFDTHELIEKGSVIVAGEFEYGMWDRFKGLPDEFWTSPGMINSVLAIANEIHKKIELRGQDALDYPVGYLFSSGPLPIDLAIEIWENGKRIFKAKSDRPEYSKTS